MAAQAGNQGQRGRRARTGRLGKLALAPALVLLLAVLPHPARAATDTPAWPPFAGNAGAGQGKAAVCAACHGADGNSVNPAWPKLAGQGGRYIVEQVVAIREGRGRDTPAVAPMKPLVANLGAADLADIAAYFQSRPIKPEAADPELVEHGERLYRAGDVERGIPACMSCHGPAGAGNIPAAFPRVGGQHAPYLETQLQAYRSGARTTDRAGMMRDIAARLSDEDIRAVASFMSGLH